MIAIILIKENQNSVSPNSPTVTKFKDNNTTTATNPGTHCGILGNQYSIYRPVAVTSAIAIVIQQIQYVHPAIKPIFSPKYLVIKSIKECVFKSDKRSSPIALIRKKHINPVIQYAKTIDGPAKWIDFPDPKNSPVPIVPPNAINWICLLFKFLAYPLFSLFISIYLQFINIQYYPV